MDGGLMTASRQVHARHVEVIARCMGDLVGGLMLEADVTDILLNEDGQVWVTRLGRDSHPAGFMPASDAESLIGAIAATLGKVATERTPVVEGELLTDGSRFLGIIPPNVKSPVFAIRKKASALIPLIEYERRGLMTSRQRRVKLLSRN
jgi:type IV secretion system protein TrbB